jgi:hypothetical protein
VAVCQKFDERWRYGKDVAVILSQAFGFFRRTPTRGSLFGMFSSDDIRNAKSLLAPVSKYPLLAASASAGKK